jgi:hypothetical protein
VLKPGKEELQLAATGGWRRALKPGKGKLQLVQGWLETNPRAGQKMLQLGQQRRGCKQRED